MTGTFRDRARLGIAVGVLLFGAAALAQGPGRPAAPVRITASGKSGLPAPGPRHAPATAPASPQAPAAPPSRKLQALLKVRFDRRPSRMFMAWAQPEPKSPEEDPELRLPGVAKEDREKKAPPGSVPATEAAPRSPAELLGRPWYVGEPASGGAPPGPESPAGGAAAAAEKATRAAARQAILAKRWARELEIFARDVTLGRWKKVAAFLASFAEHEREKAYEHLLRSLGTAWPVSNGALADVAEQNVFSLDDLVGLAAAAPGGLDKKQVGLLAPIARRALQTGHAYEELLDRLRREAARPAQERVLDRRRTALLLAALGHESDLGEFLPDAEEAREQDDREALNLIARFELASYGEDKRREHLERAWNATLAALAAGEIDEKQKTEALRRAVSLAPRIRAELGETWLEESFTSRPRRGMEVLATIGAQASKSPIEHGSDPDYRLEGLRLLDTAVSALLAKAPERARAWRGTLSLLAEAWMREAAHSYRFSQATSMGPVMRRDAFGNLYYVNHGQSGGRSPVRAIEPGELLRVRPQGRWLELVDPSMRPRLSIIVAELYLKVNEEARAFPFIEELAATHPERATELAREFVRVWIRNHDPNAARNRTNVYMFAYGFNRRANGIPLTRSKQERNLRELAGWVKRLRALPIELDENLLVEAFTKSHSTAEVYRLETIESVFGAMDSLEPKTIAALAQRMRANLASVWRRPAVQKAARTRRRQKDIEREVLRGYAVASAVVGKALATHPGEWSLLVVKGCIEHDLINYRSEIAPTSEFSGKRRAALDALRRAAELYVAGVEKRRADEETTEAFERWFYAALGASDLPAINERTVPVSGEFEKIRDVLRSIPGEAGQRHLARFANTLFTRLSAVNPAVKFRYLKGGFEIVGDHPQAYEARKVYDYYRDLVTEIRLEARVDGPTDVGTEPFGVHVDLVHTREIERESGGFGKYLQNQNNQPYAYNYGRPLENYRDKFEEAARAALAEHFDVLSITFNGQDAHSKATERYGWRRTPYAYLLLKARGPEVDRIPQLEIDLDFLDTSGYVVLPVTSPVVPIDASAEPKEPAPFEDLEITQILDLRKIDEQLLGLEIKAKARGLVPALDEILDLSPPGFEIVSLEDEGVAVTSFDDRQERVLSERGWTVKLRPQAGERPTEFRFGVAKIDGARTVYQRYDDADLVTAQPVVALEVGLVDRATRWWWGVLPLALALLGLWAFRRRRAPAAPRPTGRRLPERITPFTVLGLLEEIARNDGLGPIEREELRATIASIERYYFAASDGAEPDLARIAREWVDRAS